MVNKEFSCLKPVVQQNKTMQDFDDEEDEDETLSLCDLAVDSNNAVYWENSFGSSSSDQDLFEFLSEDFTASTCHTEHDIIFCGKIIPYEKPTTPTIHNRKKETETGDEKPLKGCNFPWSSQTFNNLRKSVSSKVSQVKSSNKSLTMPVSKKQSNNDEKFNFSVKKADMTTIPIKSRWFVFAFGSMARRPIEMELKDMKTRQNRIYKSKDNGGEITKTKRSRKGLSGSNKI